MSLIVSALAILGGLLAMGTGAPVPDAARRWSPRAAVVVGWAGVLAGAGGLYAGLMPQLSGLIATAACAGLVVLPAAVERHRGRELGSMVGGALPLVGGLASLFVNGGAEPTGQSTLLFAAHVGALGAAGVSALIACALADLAGQQEAGRALGPGPALGLAVASLCGGALLIGHARGGPVGTGWSLPLSADGEPVVWQIPGFAELPQGVSMQAVANMPTLTIVVVLAALAALAGGFALRLFTKRRKRSLLGLFAGGLLAALAALVAALVGGNARLPDEAPYRAATRGLFPDVEQADALLQQGGFSAEGQQVYVALSDLLPELTLLLGAAFIAIPAAAYAIWGRGKEEPADVVDAAIVLRLHARDFALRAVILGWLSWLLVSLIHWNYYGAFGAGSPAEWTALGVLLALTGVVLIGWRRRQANWSGWFRQLAPAIIFAIFVVGISLALIFDAPFGLSMVF